ncbi:MAG TPA: nitroreductase family deazaflavin-dependent oxidoreductase [Acidimicrobiales bacterium]
MDLTAVADEEFCYLTTTGRVTGRQHTIEIWFAVVDGRAWLLSGGGDRADWVRNLRADPRVRLRVGDEEVAATATVVDGDDDDGRARRLLAAKYQGWAEGRPLSGWATSSLLVAVDPAGA